MDRRCFIKNSSLAMLGVSAGNAVNGQTASPGMNYRRLGRTGMKISEISLGGSPVPPEAVFRRAIEAGVNYVDTSSSYMHGNSERMIAKMLKEYPGRLFVTTKFHAGRPGYDRKKLEEEFAGSLERLQVDCVDILMVHGAKNPEILADEEVMGLFDKFKKEGKIRFTGVSCHTDPLAVLPAAIESGRYDIVTVGYNAFSGNLVKKDGVYENYLKLSGIERAIELAGKHDVGVVAMKTLAGGQRQDLAKYKNMGVSLPQAKLKWVLENSAVAAAIVEMTTFDMLEEDLAVSGSELSGVEKTALIDHVQSRASRTCRMCGNCVGVCPRHVAIPDILRYALYHAEHGKTGLASAKYRRLPGEHRADGCDSCGRCQTACPNRLPIVSMLRSAHNILG